MADHRELKREQRGTGRILMLGIAVAIIIGVGLALVPLLNGNRNDTAQNTTVSLSQQQQGTSGASTSSAPPVADPNSQTRQGLGRTEEITASAENNVELSPEQKQAIATYFANNPAPQGGDTGVSISIGAAVPRQVELKDMPPELRGALPKYANDQFFVAQNRLVIVDPPTRRMLAILPLQQS